MARVGSLYDYPFTQIAEDVMRQMGEASTEDHIKAKYRRQVNSTYRFDIPAEQHWDWLRKAGTISLLGRYNTGTIACTNGSGTVTGSSTVWTSSHDGFKIKISGDDQIYDFTYVSGTSGTISPTYYGDTDSGMSYELFQNIYSLPVDFLKWPLDEAVMYHYRSGSRIDMVQLADWEFRKRYTYQCTDNPRYWRMYPGRTNLGRYRVELSAPATNAMQAHCEYHRIPPELYQVTDTTHGSTACTTTKVLTANDISANIVAGQFLSADPSTFGGEREWVQVTAVAADTTTGDGITVNTMRTALSTSAALTVCDVPDMPYTLQRAIFYGACATVAAEKGDRGLKSYLLAYQKELGLDKSRLAKILYGRQYMRRG